MDIIDLIVIIALMKNSIFDEDSMFIYD